MVDALVSGASVERRAGSSPVLGTTKFTQMAAMPFAFFIVHTSADFTQKINFHLVISSGLHSSIQLFVPNASFRILHNRNDLFVKSCGLVIYCINDFYFEIFGVIIVCHIAYDDALENCLVNASCGNMIDDLPPYTA